MKYLKLHILFLIFSFLFLLNTDSYNFGKNTLISENDIEELISEVELDDISESISKLKLLGGGNGLAPEAFTFYNCKYDTKQNILSNYKSVFYKKTLLFILYCCLKLHFS